MTLFRRCWRPLVRLFVLAAAVAITWWWTTRSPMPADFRFRVVDPGRLYRSGQMDRTGFAQVAGKHGIRTIVNLRGELPDPELDSGLAESALCRQLGIQYVPLKVGWVLDFVPGGHGAPASVAASQVTPLLAEFFKIMDNPANLPVLVHCAGGVHRTSVLVALYRMEYQHWPPADALSELDDFGYDLSERPDERAVYEFINRYRPRASAAQTSSTLR